MVYELDGALQGNSRKSACDPDKEREHYHDITFRHFPEEAPERRHRIL